MASSGKALKGFVKPLVDDLLRVAPKAGARSADDVAEGAARRAPRTNPRINRHRSADSWNGPRDANGNPRTHVDDDGVVQVAPGDTRPYLRPGSRPSMRDSTVRQVWDDAQDSQGRVFDPNTGERIDWTPGTSRRDVWDMGHTPGNEYRNSWDDYVNGRPPYDGANGTDPAKVFRDHYNDPEIYQPELPSANRSRRYEAD
ncbi:GH-E family nuclease [Enemella evansiae]|uniref:GH-E family nuclease n=1 Tax=Enemella evansiae TaxID=2016499 RepID=UPI000B966047|nr:GH-E family nuclease [Enemella evansiae]OYN99527.1 hypothetical protein CGZ95_11505 [Enemella evansiae]OYO02421.1 hypothetical protein CGZ97_13430 [Enemella evansiae]OYO12230.1 hypothetical protein CGZ98_08620 [Enemella evansiae]